MADRTLRTDVYVDGERYAAGTAESELQKVFTQVPSADGKKATSVSVADRITAPPAWSDFDSAPAAQPEAEPEPVDPNAAPPVPGDGLYN